MTPTLAERCAEARVTGQPVLLEPGTYPVDGPVGVHNLHIRAPAGGVHIEPSETFTGRALLVGAATSARGTLLEGLVLDPLGLTHEGEPVHALDTHRTHVLLRSTTCRGPVRLSETSTSAAEGGSIQSPATPYALLLDDAYLDAVGLRVRGTVKGVGRLGGASAGIQLARCILEQGHGSIALDIRGEDVSGFRAQLTGCRVEGGHLLLGPYALAELAQVRHVGATTAVLEHYTATLSAVQCKSSGATVLCSAAVVDAVRALLVLCFDEGSARNGPHRLTPWDVRAHS